MTELFDIPKQLSPRLAWLEKHGVKTYLSPCIEKGEEPWAAWLKQDEDDELGIPLNEDDFATAESEADAIVALAQKHNFKLWNEETL